MRPEDTVRKSYRFCTMLSRREARNFFHAFMLLPQTQRQSMCALYAFLRHTDDLADDESHASSKTEAISAWRRDFDSALAGRDCQWPGLPAVTDTIARHRIPVHLLHEVINGVSMDLEPRRYATYSDLTEYCYRVASVVGICCLHVWGYSSDGGRAEKLAENCGLALQLTNIIRDVRADACSGRIYLPTEDLERFNVAPEDLVQSGPPSNSLRALLGFQAQRAYKCYEVRATSRRWLRPRASRFCSRSLGVIEACSMK